MRCAGSLRTLGKGCIPQRYVLTVMCFLGVVIAYLLRTCINIAITKLVDNCLALHHDRENIFNWDEYTQGYILSSFYYGYAVANLPGAYLARRLGGKYTFGFGILISSFLSILSPFAANHSTGALIATRFAMGLAEGPQFPAVTELLSEWIPPRDRTLFSSIVYAGVHIGTVVSMSVSGLLLKELNWNYLFFIHGSLGIVWFVFWSLLCYNRPKQHPFISQKELDYICESVTEVDKKMATPWKLMLRSKPLWALTIAQLGHDYGFLTVLTDLPKYFCDIDDFTIAQNGVITALPYLLAWFVSVLLGYTCDKLIQIKCGSVTSLRRLFATVGSLVPGLGMLIASYQTDPNTKVVLVIVSFSFISFYYSSIRVNPLDLSPNHSSTIMAISNGLGALSGIVSPVVVGAFTNHNREEGWKEVFWIIFVIFIVTNIPFQFYGSGDVQSWDRPERVPNATELRRRSTISGGEPIREKYKNAYKKQPTISE